MKITSLAAAVALLVGIAVGIFATPYLPPSFGNYGRGYEAGFNAAKTLVASSSLGAMFGTPVDIRTLSGTVAAISGNQLTLRVGMTDPFGDSTLADRTVLVNASTTIVKLSASSGALTPMAGKDAILTPPLFTQTAMSLSGISIGDPLTVTAAQNIAAVKEFTATEIQIQAQAPSLAAPAPVKK